MKKILIALILLCFSQPLTAWDYFSWKNMSTTNRALIEQYVRLLAVPVGNYYRTHGTDGEIDIQTKATVLNDALSTQTRQLEQRPFTEYSTLYTLHTSKNNNTYGVAGNNTFTSWGRYSSWGRYHQSSRNNVLEVKPDYFGPKLVEQTESSNKFQYNYRLAMETISVTNELIQNGADISVLGLDISTDREFFADKDFGVKYGGKGQLPYRGNPNKADAFMRIIDAIWLVSYTEEAMTLVKTMLTVGGVKGDSSTSFRNTLIEEIDRRDPKHPIKKILMDHGAERPAKNDTFNHLADARYRKKYLERTFETDGSSKRIEVSVLQHAIDMEYVSDIKFFLKQKRLNPNKLKNIDNTALIAFLQSKAYPADANEAKLIEGIKSRAFNRRVEIIGVLLKYGWTPSQEQRTKHMELLNSWEQTEKVKNISRRLKVAISQEEKRANRKDLLREVLQNKDLVDRVERFNGHIVNRSELAWLSQSLERSLDGKIEREEIVKTCEVLAKLLLVASTDNRDYISKLNHLAKFYHAEAIAKSRPSTQKTLQQLKEISQAVDEILKDLPRYLKYQHEALKAAEKLNEEKHIATQIKDLAGRNLVISYQKSKLSIMRSGVMIVAGGVVGGFIIGAGLPFLAANYPEFAPLLANNLFVMAIKFSPALGMVVGALPGLYKVIKNAKNSIDLKEKIRNSQQQQRIELEQEAQRVEAEAKIYKFEKNSIKSLIGAMPAVRTCESVFARK